MIATDVVQDPADGARWVLPGVGSFLRTGRVSRAATAQAGGRTWTLARVGIVRTGFTAADESGVVVGEVRHPVFGGRSDRLRWAGRELTLRVEEPERRGHVLLDGDRRLAVMAPKRPARRPLDVVLEDPRTDPGLLLFMAFIVQAYADDASFPAPTPDG